MAVTSNCAPKRAIISPRCIGKMACDATPPQGQARDGFQNTQVKIVENSILEISQKNHQYF